MLHPLPEAVRRQAFERPDHPAVRTGGGALLSYGDLWRDSVRLCHALKARGVDRGHRVAIVMDNVAECAVALFGVWLADAVAVPLNAQIKPDKLEWVLRDAEVTALISERHLSPAYGPATEAIGLPTVIATGTPGDDPKEAEAYADVLKGAPTDPREGRAIPADLAVILYTSGTTGTPKGVMHTHHSLGFARDSVVEYLGLRSDDRLLCALPLSFGYGLFQLLPATAVGATVLLERNFTYPAEIFSRMRELEATTFAGVPTVFAMMLAHDEKTPLRFPTVRLVTNAAAPLPEEFIEGIGRIFPSAELVKMYGQTECIRACYLPGQMAATHPGSVGKAIPGTELLLLNESGQEVGPHETGVLHVRGANVMQGYWKDPDRTSRTLVPGPVPGERMLRTGDQFQRDEDGLLYFVSRSDDIIKSRGEKVSPTEVENAIYRLPEVEQSLVLGIPDAVLGQAVCALVTVKADCTLHPNQVKLVCRQHLEGYMVPKHVVFVEELPRNERGKLSRKLAEEVFADQLVALQAN
ncbi:MAG: class I adenylate-forming enzyme family protein [Dehalococcoidia bacterium]